MQLEDKMILVFENSTANIKLCKDYQTQGSL